MRLAISILALYCVGLAEAPKPTIPSEHQAEYWRTQLALRAAQEDAAAALQQLARDCGEKAGPAADPANPKLLACVPRPETENK